jgi:Fe-S cluster assembly protein SufD
LASTSSPPVPDWAEEARSAATKSLSTLPALAEREDWRFTRPRDLALEGPEPEDAGAVQADPPRLDPTGKAGVLVFPDGAIGQSELPGTDGVVVAELGAALATHGDLVRDHLYGLIGFDDTPGALNAARWDAGLFVHVPRGAELVAPVEALLWATGARGRVFGRTLVVVEEGGKATIVDRYGSPELPGPVQASSVVELYVGPGAEVEHVSFIQWGAGVRHHALLRARAQKDARVRSVVVTLGGDVVRVEPTMVAAGPGADARALGLYFASGEQHFEHRVVARHEAPQAYSNLLYKGALKDSAHTVFYGNLIVPPGAPGTDAYQTNRNLVLNPGARADTIPFLEIETAEVKCSHAGAVGRVDDEHLFYLRSRGVPEATAKRLIVLGYLQEVLAEITLPDVRTQLERAVEEKLA